MSLQSLEELVLYVIVLRSCFHLVCCSCWISSDISLFSVFILLMISGVANWCLRWFLVRILFLMYLWNPWLECFTAPVGWDMVFTVVYADRGEMFCGCVYVSEVVYVEVCECCLNGKVFSVLLV